MPCGSTTPVAVSLSATSSKRQHLQLFITKISLGSSRSHRLLQWLPFCHGQCRVNRVVLLYLAKSCTVVPAFNGQFCIQAKVSLHGRCPLIGGTGMLEWRAEIRCVRCSHVCHQGATNQQRSPPAAPSPRTMSKPQCACSTVLYGNMQFRAY